MHDHWYVGAQVGPHICLFKTHVDIFDHWDTSVAQKLRELADKHGKLDMVRTCFGMWFAA